MRRRSSFVAGMVLVFAVAHAERAHAQEGDLARARALYDEAGELERRGQWPQAVEKLRAALRIRETPNLRYALGWALENDDKLLEARAEYDVAERTARGTAEDVAQLARARRAELDAKTPVVRVTVPAAWRASARVTVDGRDAPVQGGASVLPVNPGARVVRVEGAGGAPVERIVYVSRGETKSVDVSAPDRDAASGETHVAQRRFPHREGAARRDADEGAHGDRVVPWVLVGGGAALAATGAVLLVSSFADASRRDDAMNAWCTQTACTGGNTATVPETPQAAAQRQEAEDAAARGNMKQTAAAILGGAGVVAAAVGGVLLVRGSESKDAPRNARGLRFVAAPTLGGVAASATLRF